MKKFKSLRPMKVKLSALRRALARAAKVVAAWKAKDERWNEWQARLCEIMLLPGMWERMQRLMLLEGHQWCYDKPRRFTCSQGLPGYILEKTCLGGGVVRWNGEPREDYLTSHAPGNCWNGVRRECYSSLAEILDMIASGHDLRREELKRRWAVEVVDDTAPAPSVADGGPALEQYRQAKARHPGMVLLFRVGDVFEALDADAELVATCCRLATAERNGVRVASFGSDVLEVQLRRLLTLGNRVAVCDRAEG